MRSSLPREPRSGVPPAGAFAMRDCDDLPSRACSIRSPLSYVELRDDDADGGELIVAAIFTYRRTSIITKRALEQELATKARHLMKRAAVGLDGGR